MAFFSDNVKNQRPNIIGMRRVNKSRKYISASRSFDTSNTEVKCNTMSQSIELLINIRHTSDFYEIVTHIQFFMKLIVLSLKSLNSDFY